MVRVYVAVGANVHPERNVPDALERLHAIAPVTAVSTFYRTRPEARPDQPDFCNGVVACETDAAPRAFKFHVLRAIEAACGRVRGPDKHAPRPIDLDPVVHGDVIRDDADLELPDPDVLTRPFIAVPLHEIAPDLRLPGMGRRVADVAAGMDASGMDALPGFTEALRRRLGVT